MGKQKPIGQTNWIVDSDGAIGMPLSFKNIYGEEAYRATSLIGQGRMIFTYRRLSSRIDLGRVACELKEIIGKQFWGCVSAVWFDGQDIDNERRKLEYAMQMYRFSVREGKTLSKDMRIDTYLHIARACEALPKNKRKAFIRKIQKEQVVNGYDIGATKKLRETIKKVQKKILDKSDDGVANKIKAKEVKNFIYRLCVKTKEIELSFKKFKENNVPKDIVDALSAKNICSLQATLLTLSSVSEELNKYFDNLEDGDKEQDEEKVPVFKIKEDCSVYAFQQVEGLSFLNEEV